MINLYKSLLSDKSIKTAYLDFAVQVANRKYLPAGKQESRLNTHVLIELQ